MALLPELARVPGAQRAFNTVFTWHPGCRQFLFCLPAYTHPSSVTGNNRDLLHDDGVNHRLVLDACHIISNHAAQENDCYLSRDRAGQNLVMPHNMNSALAAGKYYYQPGPPSSRTVANYTIVTDFAAWRYPEKGAPNHWRRPRSVKEALEIGREYQYTKREDLTSHSRWRETTWAVWSPNRLVVSRFSCLAVLLQLGR